jgi:hypothetical protein
MAARLSRVRKSDELPGVLTGDTHVREERVRDERNLRVGNTSKRFL